MTVLLCPLSSPGFLYPALAVGRELSRRGHHVHVLTEASGLASAAEAGLSASTPADTGIPAGCLRAGTWHDPAAAADQYRTVRATAAAIGAEAVLTSVLATGALIAAERAALPVAVLGLACDVWSPLPGGQDDPRSPAGSAAATWRHEQTLAFYAAAREAAGIPAHRAQPRRSPLYGDQLLLRGWPGAALGSDPAGPAEQVGPCWWEPELPHEHRATLRAWLDRSDDPVVYVHLGRVFGGDGLWPWLVDTFASGPLRAVVELGRSGPAPVPTGARLHVVRSPGMGDYLQVAQAVVTNATSAPVLGALLHRRPLAVRPNGSEQPLLAAACRAAGVARPLADQRELAALSADPAVLEAVDRVGSTLGSPSGDAGPHRAANALERLIGVRERTPADRLPLPA